MNQQIKLAAYYEGFFERAREYGFSKQAAINLIKIAEGEDLGPEYFEQLLNDGDPTAGMTAGMPAAEDFIAPEDIAYPYDYDTDAGAASAASLRDMLDSNQMEEDSIRENDFRDLLNQNSQAAIARNNADKAINNQLMAALSGKSNPLSSATSRLEEDGESTADAATQAEIARQQSLQDMIDSNAMEEESLRQYPYKPETTLEKLKRISSQALTKGKYKAESVYDRLTGGGIGKTPQSRAAALAAIGEEPGGEDLPPVTRGERAQQYLTDTLRSPKTLGAGLLGGGALLGYTAARGSEKKKRK